MGGISAILEAGLQSSQDVGLVGCGNACQVAELTRTGLRALRAELPMTLLVSQCDFKPSVQGLLWASSYPAVHVPGSRGEAVELHGPKDHSVGGEFS
jgi:hypothetical protein